MLEALVTVIPLEPEGPAVQLKMPDSVLTDNIGNVTLVWNDPVENILALVEPALSRVPEQHRNRAGAYAVTVDPGGVYTRVLWSEIDPWAHRLRYKTGDGALVAATHTVDVAKEGLRLVLYRADAIFVRGTNEILRGI